MNFLPFSVMLPTMAEGLIGLPKIRKVCIRHKDFEKCYLLLLLPGNRASNKICCKQKKIANNTTCGILGKSELWSSKNKESKIWSLIKVAGIFFTFKLLGILMATYPKCID